VLEERDGPASGVFYLYRGVSSIFALLCQYVSFKKAVSGYCVGKDEKTEKSLLN
jgi:hypothetical protein